MFRIVGKASGHRFEFGNGRFLGLSGRGVKMLYIAIKIMTYEQIQVLTFQKSWRSISIIVCVLVHNMLPF